MTAATCIRFKVALCLAPIVAACPAIGQQDEVSAFDRTPKNCISVSDIERHDAIDDQNLLFYMKNGRVYRNHLPRKCPGLERENRISFKLQGTRRLCDIDTITVLEETAIGFGTGGLPFRDGFTCRIGDFVPLSPEEIEDLDLRDEEQRRGGRQTQSTIETSKVELPPAKSADAESSNAAEPKADEREE